MKKTAFITLFVILSIALIAPAAKASAAPMPDFDVRICGTQFYINSLEYPAYVIGIGTAYGDSTSQTVNFYADDFPNDVWTDVGFPINSVDITWGTMSGPLGSFTVTGNSCMGSPLIDMYVYYSDKPFFGETNTLTIFSAEGAPSKETVTALAGGKLPDGFQYGAPACQAPLYDNGTDKGLFACDSFLASVGERRAYLRNDPDGSSFDLLPKIENYYTMLKQLGETPATP